MDLIIVKLILVLVVAGGLGIWQLHDVNRALRKPRDPDGQARADRSPSTEEDPSKSPSDPRD